MSFRQSIVFGLVFMMTTSCSYFFKEEKEKSNVYNLTFDEKSGVSCVRDNSRLLREYFDIQRSDTEMVTELGKMKKCLKDAINLFVRHTKGAQEENYSAEEIHDFLNIAFEGYNFPLDFMEEAFLIKYSLLGGSAAVVSKDEVRQLPIYIDYIYDALSELAPDRRFLFSKVKSSDTVGFSKAAAKLQAAVDRFKSLPQKKTGSFDYDGAVRLIKYFFNSDADMASWDKTFDLINSIQSMLAVGQVGTLDIQKLPMVLSNLSQFYLGYMEFNKYVQEDNVLKDLSTVFTFAGLVTRIVENPNVFTNARIEALISSQNKILFGLKRAAQNAPKGSIPLQYFDQLIDTLSRIGSIPEYIQAETLKKMIPELFGRWLRFEGCQGNSCNIQSLAVENIDVLESFMLEWKERQLWINSMAKRDQKVRTKKYFLTNLFRQRQARSANINSYLEVLSKVTHVHWEKYVVIGENKLTYKDQVIFNNLYTLAHLFFRPFHDNWKKSKISDYYLDSEKSQFFYDWLRPLALDLKLGDPRSRTSGKQALIEINLFGSNSVDAKLLNFNEAIEYFEIAISTGQKSVDIMKNQFVECRIPNADYPADVFGYERFEATCYRPLFFKQHEDLILSSLPKLKSYLNSHPKADRRTYLNYLERAGRQGLIVDEPFETDAFRMMGSISQYAESLFLRYDIDRSDVITTEELKAGFKQMIPNISELIRTSLDEKEAKQLYIVFPDFEENLITYVIKHQEIPGILSSADGFTSGQGLVQLRIFKAWSETMPSWLTRVEVKREDIVLVISALSSFSRVNRIKGLRKLFDDNELKFDSASGLTIDGDDKQSQEILHELSRLVQCSDYVENSLREWIVDNQEKYWKEALTVAEVKTGRWSISKWQIFDGEAKLDGREIPRSGLFGGWQGAVAKKFIELLFKDHRIGPYCTLPFIEDVHRVSPDQYYKTRECATGLGGMGGLCKDEIHRDPY